MIEPKLTEVTATRQFEVTEKGRVFISPVVLGFGSVADAYGNCNQFRADASGGREMIA